MRVWIVAFHQGDSPPAPCGWAVGARQKWHFSKSLEYRELHMTQNTNIAQRNTNYIRHLKSIEIPRITVFMEQIKMSAGTSNVVSCNYISHACVTESFRHQQKMRNITEKYRAWNSQLMIQHVCRGWTWSLHYSAFCILNVAYNAYIIFKKRL